MIVNSFYLTMPSTWIKKLRKRTPKTNNNFLFMTAQITQSEMQRRCLENSNETSIFRFELFWNQFSCFEIQTWIRPQISTQLLNHSQKIIYLSFKICTIDISLQGLKELAKFFCQHWSQVKNQGRIRNPIFKCFFVVELLW
jgi:hypothetical protein